MGGGNPGFDWTSKPWLRTRKRNNREEIQPDSQLLRSFSINPEKAVSREAAKNANPRLHAIGMFRVFLLRFSM
jgi:hypothetical protein